ncbi:hypothetical protein MMC09_000387 [Bachmanniomyces sp. S44760]|nr:hypothetical protein [Bachmanniomyces sp. S44760]
MSQQYQIPGTPRVISPSPTPSEVSDSKDGSYFAPVTRSAAKRAVSPPPISEENDSDSSLEKRARTRSRSPKTLARRRKRRESGSIAAINSKTGLSKKKDNDIPPVPNGATSNGHLSPTSAVSSYWRDISRSPSPLGLIPIHRHWRSFIHRHEIPRKALHVSIGFFTLHLYTRGVQTTTIHPYLLGTLIPITLVEVLRHRSTTFNRFYVRCLGALMRESEVNDAYNGVIWYLLGTWVVLRFLPKDVGVMGVLLLSWCDTAASTFGRLYGRYTPRIRKGKSFAGSAAAAVVGFFTAVLWYGLVVPNYWGYDDDFMYQGSLRLPQVVTNAIGWKGEGEPTITGWIALGTMSVVTGLIASASEFVDVWGIDDNLTIPIVSGVGLWGFLKIFG